MRERCFGFRMEIDMKKLTSTMKKAMLRIAMLGLLAFAMGGCSSGENQGEPVSPTQGAEGGQVVSPIPTQDAANKQEPVPTQEAASVLTQETANKQEPATTQEAENKQEPEKLQAASFSSTLDMVVYPEREGRLLVKGALCESGQGEYEEKVFSDMEKEILAGSIVKLSDNDELFLEDGWYDGGRQTIRYEGDQKTGYTLSVNSCTITESISATGALYAARLSGTDGGCGIQLLLEVAQTTAQYEYHVFSFFIQDNYEYLQKVGILKGLPSSISEATFDVKVYSDILAPFQYQYRQEFILCSAGELAGDEVYYGIGRVPQGCYPIGYIARLKQDQEILLCDKDTLASLETIAIGKAGAYLMLCATDAQQRIYCESVETGLCGWIYLEESGGKKQIVSETNKYSVAEVFESAAFRYGQ